MDFTEIEASLILQHIEGIGPTRFHKLTELFDSPEQLLNSSPETLKSLGGSKYAVHLRKTILNIQNNPNHRLIQASQREIEYCQQHDIQLLSLNDKRYPAQLHEIAAPPSILYIKGNPSLVSKLQIAIVGSRKASSDARNISFEWAHQLSKSGIVIASGLAEGIDAFAHQGALSDNHPTIAVLAHGLDQLYPSKHKKLSHQIVECGALVSEYAIGMKPQREFFPRRNRIISGLSRGVCIIEAAIKSGSLVTAKYALEQNRDIFAMPSHINNRAAQGCHDLIKQGANLVTSYTDILETWAMNFAPHDISSPSVMDKDLVCESPLLQHISFSPVHFDHLMQRSQLSCLELSKELMKLELKRRIIQEAGLYRRIQ